MKIKIFMASVMLFISPHISLDAARNNQDVELRNLGINGNFDNFKQMSIPEKTHYLLELLKSTFVRNALRRGKEELPSTHRFPPNDDPLMRILTVVSINNKKESPLKWGFLYNLLPAGIASIVRENYLVIDDDPDMKEKNIPFILVFQTKDKKCAQKLIKQLKINKQFLSLFSSYEELSPENEIKESKSLEPLLEQVAKSEKFEIGVINRSLAQFFCICNSGTTQDELKKVSALKKTFYTFDTTLENVLKGEKEDQIFASFFDMYQGCYKFLINSENLRFIPACQEAKNMGVSGLLVIKASTEENSLLFEEDIVLRFGSCLLHSMLNHKGELDKDLNCYPPKSV